MRINQRTIGQLVRLGAKAFRTFQASQNRDAGGSPHGGSAPPPGRQDRGPAVGGWRDRSYPGDFTGKVRALYSPQPDGRPDPGEIVWAWVPYEEDYRQGKDRPVLLIAREGDTLLGLMLTSKDHVRPGHEDRDYVDIGTGPWDRQGRPSEVKIDRIVRIDPEGIRREGAVLARAVFERVAASLPRP